MQYPSIGDLLDRYFNDRSVISFTVGLGLSQRKLNCVIDSTATDAAAIATDGLCSYQSGQVSRRSRTLPGKRAPEAFVSRLASNERMAMQRLLSNKAHFYVLIFTGRPQATRQRLQDLRERYDQLQLDRSLVETITVVGADGDSALDAMLGVESFGRTYYDGSLEAHNVYEVDPDAGAIFVIRPDGYVGAVLGLEEDQSIIQYFKQIAGPRSASVNGKVDGLINGH